MLFALFCFQLAPMGPADFGWPGLFDPCIRRSTHGRSDNNEAIGMAFTMIARLPPEHV